VQNSRAGRKACVTNPTAAGRFLVADGFTGLPLVFPHRTGASQNKLGRNAPHMLPLGCRPAGVVVQLGVGTESRKKYSLIPTGACSVTQVAPCGGNCSPVRSFRTPRRLLLFSTVTGPCPDACSSHYISSIAVTVQHHFRPPDFSKQFREKRQTL
jgi:hypothetical protein